MNAYEIRLELLKEARIILSLKHASRNSLSNAGISVVEPSTPFTTEDVVAEAEKLYVFLNGPTK